MNRLQAKGNWNIAKGKAKRAYGSMTEDPQHTEEGTKDEMLGRIQRRAGRVKEHGRKALH